MQIHGSGLGGLVWAIGSILLKLLAALVESDFIQNCFQFESQRPGNDSGENGLKN